MPRGKMVSMLLLDRRKPEPQPALAWQTPVTVRLAGLDDRPAIDRVAERDSRPAPAAPLLVAERAGELQAALSLRTGAVIADPFRHTADLVELLRCHAARSRRRERRLDRASRPRRPRLRRARLAGAAGCP